MSWGVGLANGIMGNGHMGIPPALWPEWQTHAIENFTFPQRRWRAVKILKMAYPWYTEHKEHYQPEHNGYG